MSEGIFSRAALQAGQPIPSLNDVRGGYQIAAQGAQGGRQLYGQGCTVEDPLVQRETDIGREMARLRSAASLLSHNLQQLTAALEPVCIPSSPEQAGKDGHTAAVTKLGQEIADVAATLEFLGSNAVSALRRLQLP